MSGGFSERQLEEIERARDPESIPALVAAIREQQHDLDNLRLSVEVARRDREELRMALLRAQEALRRRGEGPPGADHP